MGKASGLSALERGENAVNIEVSVCSQHALFRRCLSFKMLLLMASGVDLGARRASIMSISWGGLWAIGGIVPPQTPQWPTDPNQLMLMMLARRGPKSRTEAIKSSLRSENPDGQ